MFIKYITCEVIPGKENEFSSAQEKWKKTASAGGFICQTGGWNLNKENEACILAFWENETYLNKFMNELHDQILSDNKQENTFNKLSVEYFETILNDFDAEEVKHIINRSRFILLNRFAVLKNYKAEIQSLIKSISLDSIEGENIFLGRRKNVESSTIDLLSLNFKYEKKLDEISLNRITENLSSVNTNEIFNEIYCKEIKISKTWKVLEFNKF